MKLVELHKYVLLWEIIVLTISVQANYKDTSLKLYTYDLKEKVVKISRFDYFVVTDGAYCHECERVMANQKILYIYVGNDADTELRLMQVIDRKKMYGKHKIYFLRTAQEKQYFIDRYGINKVYKIKE